MKGPKTGRRAPDVERQRAQKLVDEYLIEGEPEALFQALKHFAEHGTFARVEDIRPKVAELIDKYAVGLSLEERAEVVAEELGVSDTTAKRWLLASRKRRREVKAKP